MMSKEADFIHSALEQSKVYIRSTGFRSVKIDGLVTFIGCSRTKFYNYFGSMNGFLILLLQEEWGQMLVSIQGRLEDNLSMEACAERILDLRKEYILRSSLLLQYCRERKLFTNRLRPIDEAVVSFDDSMLGHLLANYFHVAAATIMVDGLNLFQLWQLVIPFNTRNHFLAGLDQE